MTKVLIDRSTLERIQTHLACHDGVSTETYAAVRAALTEQLSSEPVADPMPAVRSARAAFESLERCGFKHHYLSFLAGYEQGRYDEGMYQGPSTVENSLILQRAHAAYNLACHGLLYLREGDYGNTAEALNDIIVATQPLVAMNKDSK